MSDRNETLVIWRMTIKYADMRNQFEKDKKKYKLICSWNFVDDSIYNDTSDKSKTGKCNRESQ